MYAVRNSDGNSSGRVSAVDSFVSFFVSCVSTCSGGLTSVGCMFDQMFFINAGIGIVNNGFFVRIINVVLAM